MEDHFKVLMLPVTTNIMFLGCAHSGASKIDPPICHLASRAAGDIEIAFSALTGQLATMTCLSVLLRIAQ